VCTNCKIFNALDNETFRPLEIFAVAGERFYRPRRNAAVKLISIGKTLVEKRFRTEHAEVRQCASAEQHAIRADETVVTNSHRRGRLPILFKIDTVADNLGMKSRDGRESANGDGVRAIQKMSIGDCGMFANN
jgi:hypothetical protein